VQPADLHLVDMRSSGIRQDEASHAPPALSGPVDLESALNALFEQNIPDLYEHIEETIFRAAYRYCHGNQLQTGRLLNISRNIVRARLEKIGELGKPVLLDGQ
jgi:sigma-54 dependent transcriptional regulator